MVNKLDYKYDNPIDIMLYKIIDTQLETYHKYHITPNMITTFSMISWILGAYFFYVDKYVLGAILYFISYYFDCADGKLARKYNITSKFGLYYDNINDMFNFFVLVILIYIKSKDKAKKILPLLLIYYIISRVFFYCQTNIINNKDNHDICINNMYILKYIGPGTTALIQSLIILLWKYI